MTYNKRIIFYLLLIILFLSCKDSINNDEIIEKQLTIVQPNGSEVYSLGDSIEVQWKNAPEQYNNFVLDFSSNNGKNWTNIKSGIENFKYTFVPNIYPSDSCLVRISVSNNPLTSDISDNTFSVSASSNNFDSSYFNYLQFKQGNIWIDSVEYEAHRVYKVYMEKRQYIGTENVDNKIIHIIDIKNTEGENYTNKYYIDPLNGYLYINDRFITVIDLDIGTHKFPSKTITVSSKNTDLFNNSLIRLLHSMNDQSGQKTLCFSKEFGIYIDYSAGYGGIRRKKLKGAIIDGSVYGDTSMNINKRFLKYYPLSVGNSWTYNYIETNKTDLTDTLLSSKMKKFIEKDTLINNVKYSKMVTIIEDSSYKLCEYERIDTLTTIVYRYNLKNQKEIIIDKLNADEGRSYNGICRFYNQNATSYSTYISLHAYYYSFHNCTLTIWYNNSTSNYEKYNYTLRRDIGLEYVNIRGLEKNVYIYLKEYHINN